MLADGEHAVNRCGGTGYWQQYWTTAVQRTKPDVVFVMAGARDVMKVAPLAALLGVFFGVMLLMSIVVHGQNVMRGVLEEKTTRVAEVVLSSLKPETLLAGKVVGARPTAAWMVNK